MVKQTSSSLAPRLPHKKRTVVTGSLRQSQKQFKLKLQKRLNLSKKQLKWKSVNALTGADLLQRLSELEAEWRSTKRHPYRYWVLLRWW